MGARQDCRIVSNGACFPECQFVVFYSWTSAEVDAKLKGIMKAIHDNAWEAAAKYGHKRNCAPDGIKVFPFDLSPRGWWIPSDLGIVKV